MLNKCSVRRIGWRKERATVDRLTWPLPKAQGHVMATLTGARWWKLRNMMMNSEVFFGVNSIKFGEEWIWWRKKEIFEDDTLPSEVLITLTPTGNAGSEQDSQRRFHVGHTECEGIFRPTRDDRHLKIQIWNSNKGLS